MKKIFLLNLMAFFVLVLIGCQDTTTSSLNTSNRLPTSTSMIPSTTSMTTTTTATTKKQAILINATVGKTMLDENPAIILVDVRTEDEFREFRIPGAINIPLNEFLFIIDLLIPNKQAIYIIYCRTGNKSAVAAAQLIELGYESVYDMGGIYFWPYEIISD